MRSRIALFFFLSSLGSVIVPLSAHAAIPFFGPIIPVAWNQCAASWGGLIVVINNLIELGITLAIVIVAPLTIAYAGFLLVVNPFAADAKSRARKMLLNTVIGIVVALAAWLIVDAVMAALTPNGQPFGTNWQFLIGSGGISPCLQISTTLNQTPSGTPIAGVTANGNGIVNPNGAPQCSPSNSNCSPSALQNAGFSSQQANVMSCIAMTENSGNSSGCNGVSACGTFQIVITVNQLNGPDCAQYNNGNPNINCPALCHGNNGAALSTQACQPCIQAANNPACNAESAYALYQKSGYGPWTTSSDNTQSAACVQQYSNS